MVYEQIAMKLIETHFWIKIAMEPTLILKPYRKLLEGTVLKGG